MAKDLSGKNIRSGRIGDLREVVNINPRLNANLEYFHIRVEDKSGKEFSLLLTANELKRATLRAVRNPEDLPKVRWLRDLFD